MIYLPDVNVWIALASARHKHNKLADAWIQSVGSEEAAFCRITELGLLRLLMNAHVMGVDVEDPEGAWAIYDTIRMAPQVVFLAEREGLSERWSDARGQISGGTNTITDAYLAVFAKHANATPGALGRAGMAARLRRLDRWHHRAFAPGSRADFRFGDWTGDWSFLWRLGLQSGMPWPIGNWKTGGNDLTEGDFSESKRLFATLLSERDPK